MKMKKLVSFFAAASMVLSMSAFSVNAAAENGITLEYVASDVATERMVKIYYTGSDLADGVSACEITLNVEGADVESATITLPANTSDAAFEAPDAPAFVDGQWFFYLFTGGDGGVTSADKELATLTFTVPEDTGEFTVSVDTALSILFAADPSVEVYCDEESITIPGAAVEDEEVTFDATPAGFFTYWQDAPAAKAFYATLTAEQAAKSVTWTVTDGTPEKTKTQATTVDTTLTGENDVVIGLVVSNAVEDLTATVTVK